MVFWATSALDAVHERNHEMRTLPLAMLLVVVSTLTETSFVGGAGRVPNPDDRHLLVRQLEPERAQFKGAGIFFALPADWETAPSPPGSWSGFVMVPRRSDLSVTVAVPKNGERGTIATAAKFFIRKVKDGVGEGREIDKVEPAEPEAVDDPLLAGLPVKVIRYTYHHRGGKQSVHELILVQVDRGTVVIAVSFSGAAEQRQQFEKDLENVKKSLKKLG